MESNSDISHISSQNYEQTGEIPSIHIEEFILDQHVRNLSAISKQSPKRNYPRIFTVAETLKDPLILNNIKPDYGSLGQFIGDINLSKDLLNQKKRKNDINEQEMQQKKTKHQLKQKNHEELNNIYLSKNSSALFKKVAGKLLVQNLFKQSFGVTLSTFQTQNVKPQLSKNVKINLNAIDDIFLGKKSSMQNTENNSLKKKNGEENQLQILKTNKLKKTQYLKCTKQQTLLKIETIKSRYNSLKKLQIKQSCPMYQLLLPKNDDDIQSSSQGTFRSRNCNYTIETNDKNLKLEKITIKSEVMIYLMSQFPLSNLESISLHHVRISQQTLAFMLDVVKTFCKDLSQLSLKNISLEKTQGVVIKIKELLQALPLKELYLDCMDFDTKDFCVVCLGVGSNTTLQILNFDNNEVDQRGCKSLQLILKHCSQLKRISLNKNYLQPHHFAYFPIEAKSKIIL